MSTIVIQDSFTSIKKYTKLFRQHIFKDKLKYTTDEELLKQGFTVLVTSFGDQDDIELSLIYLYIFISSNIISSYLLQVNIIYQNLKKMNMKVY